MTEQEAIMQIQAIPQKIWEQLSDTDNEAVEMAFKALEEIQQYLALGTLEELKAKIDELERWHTDHTVEEIKNVFANTSTLICHNCDHKDEYIIELESEVEELREAKEKQIPKKPKERDCIGFNTLVCPVCKEALYLYEPYCDNCGHAIDWSDAK